MVTQKKASKKFPRRRRRRRYPSCGRRWRASTSAVPSMGVRPGPRRWRAQRPPLRHHHRRAPCSRGLAGRAARGVGRDGEHLGLLDPLPELLESRGVEVVLVNARQLHHVPGRKTDVSDCQWLQLLHSCGLLRGSFRPPRRSSGSARCSARWPSSSRSARAACSGCKRPSTDERPSAPGGRGPHGHHGDGDRPGHRGRRARSLTLAAHRDRRCRKSVAEIARYLTGTWREEHLFTLASALRLYDTFGDEIAAFETRVSRSSPRSRRPSVTPTPFPSIRTPPRRKASGAGVSSNTHDAMAICGDRPYSYRRHRRRRREGRRDRSRADLARSPPRTPSFPGSGFARAPRFRGQPLENAQRPRRQSDRRGFSDGRHLRPTVQDRSRRIVSPHRAPQRGGGRRLRHRAAPRRAHLSHAALRPGLRRRRRTRL